MKIGIITYHKTHNYGAIFQTYALQNYISKNFCDCETINYINGTLKRRYSLNPIINRNIKQTIKGMINLKSELKLIKSFNEFSNKYLSISNMQYNENNIIKADEVYDSFICGSDQIWNFKLSGYDFNYFSVFSNNKKKRNSYAASMGTTLFEPSDETRLLQLINDQNYISVRENEAKSFLLSKCDKEIYQNIDPVFLIKKNDWELMADSCKVSYYKEKYILIYEVTYIDSLIEFAEKLANQTNIKIYYISASNKIIKNKNIKKITPSPEEFLNLIKYSSCVVTSSFHGMALSIILNKDFYYDVPTRKNNNYGSRLASLAELFDLSNRKISSNNLSQNLIDYKRVNKIILNQVEKSHDYLAKIIEQNRGDCDE